MIGRRITAGRVLVRLRRIVRNDQLILSALALVVGAAGGGAVIVPPHESGHDFGSGEMKWGVFRSLCLDLNTSRSIAVQRSLFLKRTISSPQEGAHP